MDRLAKESGGAHIDAETTDPKTYFQKIADELRTSYELAYYPTSTAKDDTFRKIVIQPKATGLTVRSPDWLFLPLTHMIHSLFIVPPLLKRWLPSHK